MFHFDCAGSSILTTGMRLWITTTSVTRLAGIATRRPRILAVDAERRHRARRDLNSLPVDQLARLDAVPGGLLDGRDAAVFRHPGPTDLQRELHARRKRRERHRIVATLAGDPNQGAAIGLVVGLIVSALTDDKTVPVDRQDLPSAACHGHILVLVDKHVADRWRRQRRHGCWLSGPADVSATDNRNPVAAIPAMTDECILSSSFTVAFSGQF